MTLVTRIRLMTGVLGVAAATAVVATSVFGDLRQGRSAKSDAPPITGRTEAERVADEFAKSRFATQPTLTFKDANGQTVFAW